LLLAGLPGGNAKTTAQSLKAGEAKKKPMKEKGAVEEESEPIVGGTKPAPAANTGLLRSFLSAAEFTPPAITEPATTPQAESPAVLAKPPENPAPETPTSEKPAPEKPNPEKPAAETSEPAAQPAKAPPPKGKSKPAKNTPRTSPKKNEPKRPAAKGPPPATADCEVCRAQGRIPLNKPQPYVWMEGQPVPKGASAMRDQYCPNCKPGADNAYLAAAEDLRLKTAMDVHLDWEKRTTWQLVRAETRRVAIHSQLPPAETQQVALALEAMSLHVEGLTGSVELTSTTPSNCNVIILFQRPSYTQFVNLLKADPVIGPSRQDWALVGEVAGTWVKDTIFYRYIPDGPPPDHQAIALVSAFQIHTATGYKDPPWLNVGYAAYCENATLHANRVTSLEYALNNLQIDPDWSLAVLRLAAAGALKPWNDMFSKILRDYQAEDHLTAYAMVSFLIQYKPREFLDFVKETKGGLGSREALEKAYGEKVPELQQRWVNALGGR
jgi:hypothetical protein